MPLPPADTPPDQPLTDAILSLTIENSEPPTRRELQERLGITSCHGLDERIAEAACNNVIAFAPRKHRTLQVVGVAVPITCRRCGAGRMSDEIRCPECLEQRKGAAYRQHEAWRAAHADMVAAQNQRYYGGHRHEIMRRRKAKRLGLTGAPRSITHQP